MKTSTRESNPKKAAQASGPGIFERLKRAYAQFLLMPTIIIVVFMLFAVFAYWLDRASPQFLQPVHNFLTGYVFGQAQTVKSFLSTLTSGMMTVTSIIISILLLVLQQIASTMSHQVVDQFLHRRRNQVIFGFLVGTVSYNILTLAFDQENLIQVYGAFLSILFTILSVYLLVMLVYSAINQMRPATVINSIHDLTLRARQNQLSLVQHTRRTVQFHGPVEIPVKSEQNGFVGKIDYEHMAQAVGQAQQEVEVELLIIMGERVIYGSTIARVRANNNEDAVSVGAAVQEGIQLERQQDIHQNPNYGLQQLEVIGWTASSTSKQTVAPTLLILWALSDLAARWLTFLDEEKPKDPLPVVYYDNTWTRLWDTFEALAVVSTESMQFQVYAEMIRSFTVLYGRLPEHMKDRVDTVILRLLSGLGDHLLTRELEASLRVLIRTLREAGHDETADAVDKACEQLGMSIGHMAGRSTRANFYQKQDQKKEKE